MWTNFYSLLAIMLSVLILTSCRISGNGNEEDASFDGNDADVPDGEDDSDGGSETTDVIPDDYPELTNSIGSHARGTIGDMPIDATGERGLYYVEGPYAYIEMSDSEGASLSFGTLPGDLALWESLGGVLEYHSADNVTCESGDYCGAWSSVVNIRDIHSENIYHWATIDGTACCDGSITDVNLLISFVLEE